MGEITQRATEDLQGSTDMQYLCYIWDKRSEVVGL